MKKTISKKTKAKKTVKIINAGGIWEDAVELFDNSISYLQKIVRETCYTTETGYNKLLAKARANKKARLEAEKLINTTAKPDKEAAKTVVVTETGYLMSRGPDAISKEKADVYIPLFCVKELEKLSRASSVAEEIIARYYDTRVMTSICLRGKEVLFEEPKTPVKDRSKGVVALCCHLWVMDYKVRLLTNSKEIQELAEMQGIDISVVKVS